MLNHGSVDYPQAGAAFLEESYPAARMLNHYDWGGYLINEMYPRKVFIDGRSDFYGPELMNDFLALDTVAPSWESVLLKHDIEVILIKDGSPLSSRLDSETDSWVRVFTGEYEVVYARTDIATP